MNRSLFCIIRIWQPKEAEFNYTWSFIVDYSLLAKVAIIYRKSDITPPMTLYTSSTLSKILMSLDSVQCGLSVMICSLCRLPIVCYFYVSNCNIKSHTVRAEIFAVVLFSRISRVKPSRKFPLQFMSIYSNDNISQIAKLTTRELPHLAKTAKITVREYNDVYSSIVLADLNEFLSVF